MMKEEWKAIEGFEGLYEISNLGRVKSLEKEWIAGNYNSARTKPETIRKHGLNSSGYLIVSFCKNGKLKTKTVHSLVFDHFCNKKRNGRKLCVDHRDNDKTNNRIDNLQLLTARENCSKECLRQKKTSRFTGVCYHNGVKKWQAQIRINGKQKYLGIFTDEYTAHLAYQKALKQIGGKK